MAYPQGQQQWGSQGQLPPQHNQQFGGPPQQFGGGPPQGMGPGMPPQGMGRGGPGGPPQGMGPGGQGMPPQGMGRGGPGMPPQGMGRGGPVGPSPHGMGPGGQAPHGMGPGGAGQQAGSSSQGQQAAALIGAQSAPGFKVEEKKLPTDAEIVNLNVGGVKFRTTLATLRKHQGTLTAEIFAEDNLKKYKPGKDGAYFIDRNGDAFETVLEFLRTGKLLHASKKVNKDVVEEELRHWRISQSLVSPMDQSPITNMADRYRQQTLNAMYREGRMYVDIFMQLLTREMETASSYAKSQVYLIMGDPSTATSPSPSKLRASSTSKISGKHLHDANLHRWCSLRRGHLTLIRKAVEREGLNIKINTGLPDKDWIQFVISWPLDPAEPAGKFQWE